jgi:predicted AAA+ superfamily ATPase
VAQSVELSRNTLVKYLDLLEKSFIIFRVGGFSRNLRNEIKKNDRFYFYDNGVRNALINNYNDIPLRNDLGQLWENYIVIERIKRLAYSNKFANTYFWRTHDHQEIDWVEERGGNLHGYEITWKDSRRRIPSHWLAAYPGAEFSVITSDNYLDFITSRS